MMTPNEGRKRIAAEMNRRWRCSGVVCMRCGSMMVDPRCLSELACSECGQTARWDGTKFTTVQAGAEEGMFATSLMRADYRERDLEARMGVLRSAIAALEKEMTESRVELMRLEAVENQRERNRREAARATR